MKALFVLSHACLVLTILFLAYDANSKPSFPFGGPTKPRLEEYRKSKDRNVLMRDNYYVGYQANNQYCLNLTLIALGVAISGAIGFYAIKKPK